MIKRTRKRARRRKRRTESSEIVIAKPAPETPPKPRPRAVRPVERPPEPEPTPEPVQAIVLPKGPAPSEVLAPRPAQGQLENPVRVYLARLGSQKSRLSMADALKRILRALGVVDETGQVLDIDRFHWHSLNYDQIEAVRTRLSEDFSPSTANHALCALRGVFRVAWKQGRVDTDTYQRAKSIEGVKGSRLPVGRYVENEEVKKLLDACGSGARAARDAAAIAMLYGCGLRRAELAELRVENIELETRNVRIIGKGNKERDVFMPPGTYQAVKRWLKDFRGEFPGPLLLRIQHKLDGQIIPKGITDESVRKILERVQKAAGIKHLSPHDIRRTYISDLLDKGADIVTVQKLAGHASPTTTSQYDRRGEQTKKKAANLLSVPYFPKKKREKVERDRKPVIKRKRGRPRKNPKPVLKRKKPKDEE